MRVVAKSARPLLQRAHRDACGRHAPPDGVSQIVEGTAAAVGNTREGPEATPGLRFRAVAFLLWRGYVRGRYRRTGGKNLPLDDCFTRPARGASPADSSRPRRGRIRLNQDVRRLLLRRWTVLHSRRRCDE